MPGGDEMTKEMAIDYLASSFVGRVPANKQKAAASALLAAIPKEFQSKNAKQTLLSSGQMAGFMAF